MKIKPDINYDLLDYSDEIELVGWKDNDRRNSALQLRNGKTADGATFIGTLRIVTNPDGSRKILNTPPL